jgi:hypothetical protein
MSAVGESTVACHMYDPDSGHTKNRDQDLSVA